MLLPMPDARKLYIEYHPSPRPLAHTVLFIHGGPGESCITFHKFAKALSSYANAVLADQRSVLRSEWEPDRSKINIRQAIQDFESIRRQLGFSSWSLLGHSFGARIALSYAAAFPQHVQAVILENPAIDMEASVRSLLSHYRRLYQAMERPDTEYQSQELERAAQSGNLQEKLAYLAQVPSRYRCICFGNHVLDKESQSLLQYPGFGQEEIRKCQEVMASFRKDPELGKDGAKVLEAVRCPILLLRDAKDPMLPEEQARLIRKKGSEILFEDGSHYLHLKYPERMSKAIGDFLHASRIGKNNPPGNPQAFPL